MRKPSTLLSLATLASALAVATPAAADNVELRIATLAPSGSPWMATLDKASVEIKEKTAGRVTLKYFPGGQQGDERDFVRKIRLGQLDGAAVTAMGLAMIDSSTIARPIDVSAAPSSWPRPILRTKSRSSPC